MNGACMLGFEVGKHTQLEAQARAAYPKIKGVLIGTQRNSTSCWGNNLSCSSRDARECVLCFRKRDRGCSVCRHC